MTIVLRTTVDIVLRTRVDMELRDANVLETVEGSGAMSQQSCVQKTSCIRQRHRLLAARAEAASLQRQLESLHENRVVFQSIDLFLNDSSDGDYARWKARALQERSLKKLSKNENARLRQRVAANAMFLNMVRNLVHAQEFKTLTSNRPLARLSDDAAFAFSTLKARLDSQSNQLDAIFAQCDTTTSEICVSPTPWTASTTFDGVNAVFGQSFDVPFASSVISDAVSQDMLLHEMEVLADNVRS